MSHASDPDAESIRVTFDHHNKLSISEVVRRAIAWPRHSYAVRNTANGFCEPFAERRQTSLSVFACRSNDLNVAGIGRKSKYRSNLEFIAVSENIAVHFENLDPARRPSEM